MKKIIFRISSSYHSLLAAMGLALITVSAYADHGAGGGATYSFLEAGFTQDLVGISQHFAGDVVFANDGDLFLSDCQFNGSELHEYDMQGASPIINGTASLHPETIVASNAGCGLIAHPDGFIYSNTSLGIVQLDGTTGVSTGLIFGAPGNALGIAVNPANGHIMHMGASNGPVFETPVGDASIVFSNAHAGGFVDEIVYDPSGLLYLATRSGGFRITVVNPDGTLNRTIPLPSEPDGMAFHATQNFMITMNLDGTITKVDLSAGDALSTFASGGARHDMSTVGADGCVYNTQDNLTTYDDGTVTGESSIVRICGGFAPSLPVPLDVRKTWRHTNVCFETDNDADGQHSEDAVDGLDNDQDGLVDEDPSECPNGTNPGDIINNDGNGNYSVQAVVRKNGKVSSYNPGQLYAVVSVSISANTNELHIGESYDDCTMDPPDLLDLNPKKGGGRAVVVVEHADGTLEQVFNANTDDPNVVFISDENGTTVWWSNGFTAGDIVHLYVKFSPGKNSTGNGSCENWADATVSGDEGPIVGEDHAILTVTPKEK